MTIGDDIKSFSVWEIRASGGHDFPCTQFRLEYILCTAGSNLLENKIFLHTIIHYNDNSFKYNSIYIT